MNSKERLDCFVRGNPVDYRPNLTIVGSMVTQYTGIGVDTYCLDYRKMADAAVLCARDAGLDFVQIASDLQRTSEGYGTQLNFYPDRLPAVKAYALKDISEVAGLRALKAKEIPRLFELVKAAEYAAEQAQEIYPMVLCEGPVTVAGNIRGIEDFLVDMNDEPEYSEKLLDLAVETTLDFIDELAKVGVKYAYMPDPVASLLSPKAYETFVLARHRKIYARMEERGICGRLHMCGNTEALLPYSSTCGAKIIDIDYAVSFDKALAAAQRRCILNGNINPVSDVYSADAEHTYRAILALGKAYNRPDCMFMPGCELPTNTNISNLKAIARAIQDIGAVG